MTIDDQVKKHNSASSMTAKSIYTTKSSLLHDEMHMHIQVLAEMAMRLQKICDIP